MANFTQEEINAAVKKYIRTDTRTTRDPLGPRDTDKIFADVMEFVSSGLVFDPNSIFYLIYLVKNRVNQDLNTALALIADLKQAILEVGKYTSKVTSTSLLSDAASALLEADRLLTQKQTIASPQFNRYGEALDQFVGISIAPNIRELTGSYPETYSVVRPPQAAQEAIKSDIISLRAAHTTILAETEQLSLAFDEFLAQNLPTLAIQTSVQKVQKDLKALQREFDSSTEAEAIGMTRDAYLRIVAGRSVITNLVTTRDPTSYRMQGSVSSSDRAQVAYPASSSTPGQVITGRSATYHIVPGVSDQLNFKLDGGALVSVTLTPPAPARVLGSNSDQSLFQFTLAKAAELTSSMTGPYTVPVSPGNVFDIYVDGIGYRVDLTDGVDTAAQVAAEVMVATRIDSEPGTFGDVALATSVGGVLSFLHATVGTGSITIGSQTVNSALGFTDGQADLGTAANNILRLYVDDELEVLANLTVGGRTAAQVAVDITAASARVLGGTVTLDLAEGVTISSRAYGEQSRIQILPTTPVHRAAMSVLGFSDGQSSRSSYLSLDSLYSTLNAITGIQVTRSSSLLASGTTGQATLGGSDYILVLPSDSIPIDPNPPHDPLLRVGDCLLIKGGENSGYFRVLAFAQSPIQDTITVGRPFAVTSGAGAQNQSWELRRDLLTIVSMTLDLTSSLEVQVGTANTELGLVLGIYRGMTSGVQVLESGKVLSFVRNNVLVGDYLQFSGPTYRTLHTVTEVSENGYQIEVTPEVPDDLTGQYYFIEGASAKAYLLFISALQAWLSDIGASVFKSDILDLERKLNPLLYNMHPTTGMINDALHTLAILADPDTETGFYYDLQRVFLAYSVAKISLVDSMLDMLLEKGMRRGHDLLLLGQFVNFFAVNRDTSSYSGNMMEKMRKVVQNDVPVSRGVDGGQGESQLTGSFTDIDYSKDFSDGDDERAIAETDDIPEPDVDDQILTGF